MIDKTEREIVQNWHGEISEPLVSICTITYNHEKFIAEALNSFLMQETSFPFEIVIDDDCSRDGTANIIREYAARYPSIIKPNLREKNVGMIENFVSNIQRAEGKYTALCEGDDFWTSPFKLQVQAKALDENIGCSIAFHEVDFVTEEGVFLRKHSWGRANQDWSTGVYGGDQIVGSSMTIPHTSSMFFRKEFFDIGFFDFLGKISGGDYPLTVSLCNKGCAYFLIDTMSAYRQNSDGVSHSRSYATNTKLIKEIEHTHYQMNMYFNKKFEREIKRHLIGQLMMKYHSELNMSIDSGDFVGIIKNLTWMILKHKNSQFSLRDIFWLFKEKLKEKNGQ